MDAALPTADIIREATQPDFAAYRDRHKGESILVCGCGESLELLKSPVALTTIGVNDVGRQFTPTYLVVLNPESQFSRERFAYIRNTGARAVFTQYGNLPVPANRRVLLRLGQYGGTDFSKPGLVHYTQNSPYVAVSVAIHLGARRIGLLGVDFGTRSLYGGSAPHPLQRMIDGINAEYAKLAAACAAQGIELFNLSPTSKLSALPRMPVEDFLGRAPAPLPQVAPVAQPAGPSVLVVDYDFLTCGRVFGEGLARAAASIGVRAQTTLWNNPGLPALVDRFDPDLILVVHGRSFAQRWGKLFEGRNTAVWLLDEPYEVDDTARWSGAYRTVFVNDQATVARHRNAHYLPVCYDAVTHRDPQQPRRYRVGFIGGANVTRERYLGALAAEGLLDYVVGGPWSIPDLSRLSRAAKISPAQVTEFYQATDLIINVFRDIHHYNRQGIAATAPNPRLLEAIACGAAVVSEQRVGMGEMFPDLPQFESPEELLAIVRRCVADPVYLAELKRRCHAQIEGEAYSDRLTAILRVVLPRNILAAPASPRIAALRAPDGWSARGIEIERGDAASWLIRRPDVPAAQAAFCGTGFISDQPFAGVDLRFTARFERDAVLIARLHQNGHGDANHDAYELVATATGTCITGRGRVLCRLQLLPDTWIRVRMRWLKGWLEIWTDDDLRGRFCDSAIASGYCFIGSNKGTIAVHSISTELAAAPSAQVIPPSQTAPASAAPASAASRDSNSTVRKQTSDSAERMTLPDLGSATRRNLIYHVWPKLGSNWRWNIEQLLARIDLFNGKRVISIVEDSQSEPPAAVMELLADHGCEFLVQPNSPAGEAISFPGLLQKVASVADDELTFYAHAKGVKYGLPCPPNVQRWSDALYRTSLDDWLSVRAHLSHRAMTGSFRIPGRFTAHRQLGDWHYSGTFFWMRNAAVFVRAWQQVQQFYYGVEAWPGSLFRREETGCLLLDDLGPPLPYLDEFWRRRGNQAVRDWEMKRRDVEVPPDLAVPAPFDGIGELRLEHKAEEFSWWLAQLKESGVRRLLTIGSAWGAPEWHTARIFREAGLDIEITTIEPAPRPELEAIFAQARTQFGQRMILLTGSPRDPKLLARLEGCFDAAFIDGNHRYDQVRADFLLARSLKSRLIGLHDIVDSDWHAANHCAVSRLWSEITAQYPTEQRSSGVWAGIGIVRMDQSQFSTR